MLDAAASVRSMILNFVLCSVLDDVSECKTARLTGCHDYLMILPLASTD